jgi:hypothetical protein
MLSVTADVISYKYVQSGIVAADCETLMVDSNGDIYLITKWNAAQYVLTRVLRIPAGTGVGTTLSLSPLSSSTSALSSNTFTRGDTGKDGTRIVMGSVSKYYVWKRQLTRETETGREGRAASARRRGAHYDDLEGVSLLRGVGVRGLRQPGSARAGHEWHAKGGGFGKSSSSLLRSAWARKPEQ